MGQRLECGRGRLWVFRLLMVEPVGPMLCICHPLLVTDVFRRRRWAPARPPAGVCNPNPQLFCHGAPDPLLLCVPCPPGAGKQGAALPAPHCGWGTSPDTSPVIHCSGDLPGSTLPRILRTLPRHGCRQGVPMLRAHPRLWGLRGLRLSETHNLEGSGETTGCWGPDGRPWGSRLS